MIDDLPARPANSVLGTDVPVDSTLHWTLARWLRAQAGMSLADLMGPFWVAGGVVSVYDAHTVMVTPVEGWPLEEVEATERFATRVVAYNPEQAGDPNVPDGSFFVPIDDPSISPFWLVTLSIDGLRVHPIRLIPHDPQNLAVIGFTYAAAPRSADLEVPLAVVVAGTADAGILTNTVLDLRTPAGGWVYAPHGDGIDKDGNPDPLYIVSTKVPDTDSPVQKVGVQFSAQNAYVDLLGVEAWVYAAAGAIIEVNMQAQLPVDIGLSVEMSPMINGEGVDGGDLTRAGVELVHGLSKAKCLPSTLQADFISCHVLLKSTVSAVHDIRMGFRADLTLKYHYVVVGNPQLRVRVAAPLPAEPKR